jgi:hypothetical protein
MDTPQTKEFEIKGNITDGNVSVNSVTYNSKVIPFEPNNKIVFDENTNQINLTPDQTTAIKNALKSSATSSGGKSKKSYKKRKPKRNTRRTNRK